MQGNLIATLLALIFYVASGVLGGNSGQTSSNIPANGPGYNQGTVFPRSGILNINQVGLRSNPTLDSTVIDTVRKGDRLLVIDQKNDWRLVQTQNGEQGWVAKWTVSLQTSYHMKGQKVIAGYYVENYYNDPVGYKSLQQNLGAINTIIPFAFQVDQKGTIKSSYNSKSVTLAHSGGADAIALVNNIQGGNFSSNSIHKMLNSSVARSKTVNGIARLLIEKGFQGVNIDFENVPARDRIYVTAFFRELAAVLQPKNLLVTASLPAKTFDDQSSQHSGAFDYRALAPYLDQAMLMTYDEHYSGGRPGPVASYPWVKKVINYSLRYFPANKIVLGLAAYGYDWSWKSGKAMHYNKIQSLIKQHRIIPKWSSTYKVPYFTYKSWGITHQVWYEDRNSTATKAELVRQYGLKGVAVWRLGYEDPAIWGVIQQGIN